MNNLMDKILFNVGKNQMHISHFLSSGNPYKHIELINLLEFINLLIVSIILIINVEINKDTYICDTEILTEEILTCCIYSKLVDGSNDSSYTVKDFK